MGTLVCLHAHPDDESISTGGSMARAADEGHRVVLVVATDGSLGEVPDDLADGETLVDRRRHELARSAAILGVHRVVWLGYRDSGMTGWKENDAAGSFWQADLDEAAGRLADLLRDEQATVLVAYDWHGGYGHPDHVKAHRVGHRAAELAGTPRTLDVTMNRDAIVRFMEQARTSGLTDDDGLFDPNAPADDGNPFGTAEVELTLPVDVTSWVDRKRQSILCHASQVTDVGFFSSMPAEAFEAAFSTEWFVEQGATPNLTPGWFFDGP